MAVKKVSIEKILKETERSVDFWWKAGQPKWSQLLFEKIDPRVIEALLYEGQKYPIWWDGRELGNGHHRLCAAILLGWDEILVTDEKTPYGDFDYSSTGWDWAEEYTGEEEFPWGESKLTSEDREFLYRCTDYLEEENGF